MKIKNFFLTALICSLIGFLLGTVAGLIIGIKVIRPSGEKEVVSSTVVLDRLQEQSFLVTRSVLTDQEVEIEIDQGSAWSNFWWGHEITAKALIQTDLGVDLSKLTEEDIIVDKSNKEITLNLPDAEIYNISLNSDIEVSTKSGLLKYIFDSDDNEDYNLALDELSTQTEEAIGQDTKLLAEAQSSALSTLQVLLKDTDYEVVLKSD
jgi:hypothetical protein